MPRGFFFYQIRQSCQLEVKSKDKSGFSGTYNFVPNSSLPRLFPNKITCYIFAIVVFFISEQFEQIGNHNNKSKV
jgi:hypothetical protein